MATIEWAPASGICVEINIGVSNPTESLRFYRDTLGLEIIGEVDVPARHLWALQAADCIIKLVYEKQPVMRSNPRVGLSGAERVIGYFAVTMNVKNGDVLLQECEDAGFEVTCPWEPMPSAYNEQAGRDTGYHGSVRDPDGNLIGFVHGDPWVRPG